MEGPDVVVADEAHTMKNPATIFCKAMMQARGVDHAQIIMNEMR